MKKLSNAYWIFLVVWYMIGFIFNVFIILFAISRGEWSCLLLLALWWAVTLTGRKIRHIIEKRHKAKEQKEIQAYKEKYVTEAPVDDERFGKIVFERDINSNTVGATEFELEKPLGRHKLLLYAEIDGDDAAPAVKALGYVYDNIDEILEGIYEYTLEACDDYNERDKNGNPYDLKYVQDNLDLYSIHVGDYQGSVFVSIDGDICGDDGNDLLGCHSVSAQIELNIGDKPELIGLTYGLEG